MFIPDYIQAEVVNKKFTEHNILRGAAGTGKTTVVLAKAKKIANADYNQKVLFVSFTKSLINFTKLIEKLPPNLEARTFHSLFAQLYRKAYGRTPRILATQDIIDSFIIYARNNLDLPKTVRDKTIEDFAKEIKFIQDYDMQTLDEYLIFDRIGQKTGLLRKNRNYYWQIYELYMQQLIRTNYTCDWDGASAEESAKKTAH